LSNKKEDLQEQQLHLNTGLDKLKETEEEVTNLQQNVLIVLQKELKVKEEAANEKLKTMVKEQNNVEKKKEMSIKTSEEIKIKQEEIAKRQEVVNNDLGKAEPALIEAQESVNSIEKSHLDEIRALAKPPDRVKYAIEAVCILIFGLSSKPEWKECRSYLKETNFIATVMNFDKDSVLNRTKKFIRQKYLDDSKNWDIHAIFKASKAAGPLAKWVQSLIEYADIFLQIEPLRNEVKELQESESSLLREHEELITLIGELEEKLTKISQDYALLIAEVEQIKKEKESVTNKVERSIQLISNLSSERDRWNKSCEDLKYQMATLLGDCLLSGAFLTYSGFFDHYYRKQLIQEWKVIIKNCGIKYKDDTSLIEYLSIPDERLKWHENGLPEDDLCVENAIVLKHYNRYPLVIDPNGQALGFIENNYSENKVKKTSFSDGAFMKNLESSIRFGYPLLVQDVERIDPVLNSVLNKEIHKTGGRVLIRVGDQEIDFSPTFSMYMITRNSQIQFAPGLCSRVTFVNFTVTQSSLENQCLNIYMKSERPEIDKKKQDLLKLQGECKVKLRALEDELLNTISTIQGSILENDQLISTLETIKKESIEIAKEVEKSGETMHEIELVNDIYRPLSIMTSKLYFTLERISAIHYLYQFSLDQYMQIVFSIIEDNEDLASINKSDHDERLVKLVELLFEETYSNISTSLLQEDKIVFALSMTDILRKMIQDGKLPHLEFMTQEQPDYASDDEDMENEMARMEKYGKFAILRPDKINLTSDEYINKTMSSKSIGGIETDFGDIVKKHKAAHRSPYLLISAPGYDASTKIEDLAKKMNKKYFAVAIGSAEGYELAEKNISSASKIGSWVLLKNVHLAPSWLEELEKKLHELEPHKNFRMFMTMEFNPKVPSTLIRMSKAFVFEPPSGIKASLIRTYTSVLNSSR
jgi:dynein heavy chain 1